MKPKKLTYPYSWQERRPLLKGCIFYVPDYYQEHDRSLFPSFETLFGNKHPVHIEYCSGNGEWVIDKALNHPELNWIAVEKKFERVCKIYSKARNNSLENLFVISGEALTFAREYLPDACLDSVYVNFPDPWPKDRHAKHRLIQRSFSDELWRTMKKAGGVTLVTDNIPYLEQMKYEMQEWTPKTGDFSTYGSSYFERLWLSKGLKIHYLHYER